MPFLEAGSPALSDHAVKPTNHIRMAVGTRLARLLYGFRAWQLRAVALTRGYSRFTRGELSREASQEKKATLLDASLQPLEVGQQDCVPHARLKRTC